MKKVEARGWGGAAFQVAGTEPAKVCNSECDWACFRDSEEFGVGNEEGLEVGWSKMLGTQSGRGSLGCWVKEFAQRTLGHPRRKNCN